MNISKQTCCNVAPWKRARQHEWIICSCTFAERVFSSVPSGGWLLYSMSEWRCESFSYRWKLWSICVFVEHEAVMTPSIPDVAKCCFPHKQCLIHAWNDIKTSLLRRMFEEELFVESDRSVLARDGGYTRIVQETIAAIWETSRVHRYNTWCTAYVGQVSCSTPACFPPNSHTGTR